MQTERLNEELTQVVALHPDRVELAARDGGTCGSCAARAGCGHGLLDSLGRGRRRTFMLPRTAVPADVHVGEALLLGVPEGAIARAAGLVYGLPLAGLVAGAVLAPGGDGTALLSAGLGLAAGWLLARRWSAGRAEATLQCRRPGAGGPGAAPSEAEPRALTVV
jgi:sigma-E factor negative regulatory protein RseC